MSLVKSLVPFQYLPTLRINSSRNSQTSDFVNIAEHQSFFGRRKCFKCLDDIRRIKHEYKSRRSFAVYASRDPKPFTKPFSLVKWIIKVILTIILPLVSYKWSSLFKLKNEVETGIESVGAIAEGVEKAAEGVEIASKHIAEDLPKDARSRDTVVLVEHVAENISKGAHIVEDFIHKVE